jgi:hypothetical protein
MFQLALASALLAQAAPTPPAAPCHWTAAPYVQVMDGKRLPDLGATPVYSAPTPSPTATPAPLVANPTFLIDAKGRVHAIGGGKVSSIVTISGGGCTPAHVAVLIYSDGYLPQRSIAFDFGAGSVYDELSPGNIDWRKYLAHAEIEGPLNLRGIWLAVDARSIVYRHQALSGMALACPPAPPAPAPGGAAAGDQGCVTALGGRFQQYRTGFGVRDDSAEMRGGIALGRGAPVIDAAYLIASNNAGRPTVSGFGVGVEVPPLLDQPVAAYGALSYYPNLGGGGIRYRVLRYRVAATLSLTPLLGRRYFFELATVGDRRTNLSNAPASSVYQAIALGAGIRF